MAEDLQPEWLDQEFLQEVLKSVESLGEETQLRISKWHCKHAVPPGTNYLSVLYRLFVDYDVENESRSISLIVKTPLKTGKVKEFVDMIDGYGKELRMYKDVLPRMYEIAENSETLTARSYVCPLHNALVLEDLRELGYKMSDRLKQLDEAHCRQFLISLAKFHGLAVALNHKDSKVIESVGKSFYFDENAPEEMKKQNEDFLKFQLSAMLKTIESMALDRYAEIIRGKIDSFYDTMQRIFKPSGELRVLNHGDCWTTNVLFKYDFHEVSDARLVDFQVVRMGSFAQDVIYFWWTSARQDVRENLQDELFEVYRNTLNQTLESVQVSDRVSKEEFDSEIKRFSPFALQVCCSLLTIAMADPDDLLDFNDMTEEDIVKPVTENSQTSKNYRSKYYKALLPDLLRQLERFGAFA